MIAYRHEVTEEIEREKMTAKIYAAVTDDFVRRMRNWAHAEAGCSMSMISHAYDAMPSDGWGTNAPIILEGEAHDTSDDLQRVAIRYRQAVMQFWRYEGLTLRKHARMMRREGINHETFQVWVMKGHDELVVIRRQRKAAYHDLVERNQLAVCY